MSALTLKETIKRALATNPTVLGGKAAARSSKEAIDIARAGYFPAVNVSNSGGYQYTKEKSYQTPFSSSFNAHANRFANNFNLTLSQLIFDGFLTISQVKQAKSEFAVSENTVESTQENTALQAAQSFYSILNQQGLIEVAEEDIAAHKAILYKTERRVAGGIGTRADIEQVNARLSDAYVALTNVKGQLENSIADFMSVVGVFPTDLEETSLPLSKIPESLEKTLEKGLTLNPSLMAAKNQLKVTMAQFDQTEAPFWPSFNVQTSLGGIKNSLGAKSDTKTVSVFLVGNYNLFNGGGDIATLRSQREKVTEAKYTVATTQRALERNIEQAWVDRQTAIDRLRDLEYALIVKKKLVDDYNIQFDLGDRSLFETLDAYRDYYLSKANYVITWTVIKVSEAKLLSYMAELAKCDEQGNSQVLCNSEKH